MAYNGTDIQNSKAYALILDNSGDAENPVPMIFVRADSAPVVGQTYASEFFGALPVTAVYTDIETTEYYGDDSGKLYPTWATDGKYANVTSVAVEDEIAPVSTCAWFRNMSNCKAMNLKKLNTENVKSMAVMFQSCSALTSLDVSHFDTANVNSMRTMFNKCSGLTTLDISDWDTSNVTTMRRMFQSATGLESLDLSEWDISKVTDTNGMFLTSDGKTMNLKSIGDVSNWDTSNITDMSYMFQLCSSLEDLNVDNWDTSKVTNMQYMFYGCSDIETLNVSNWDTSKVTNMQYMFCGCTNLETLDVSNWDVSKVATMMDMFSCGSDYGQIPMKIKNLNVSNWDTSSCTDMSFMFYGCQIGSIDLSKWDVSKVTTFDHMFAHSYIKIGDVSNWYTPAATNMNAMFYSVANETLDVSKLVTKNVTCFDQMFENCQKLTKIIGLEKFDTSSSFGFSEMFQNCYMLKKLDLSSFDTRKAKDGAVASSNGSTTTSMSNMFYKMYGLEKITLGKNFSFNGDGTSSNIAVLPTPAYNYIELADGKWYTEDGVSYASTNIPSRTAGTYYAYNKYVADQDYLTKGETILKLVNAIKNKVGSSDAITIDQIINVVKNRLYLVATLCPLANGSVTVNDTKLTISYGNHVKISGSGGSYSQAINISDIQMGTVIGNLSEKYVVPAGSTLTMKFKNIVWDETAKASYSEVGSNFKKAGSNDGVLPTGKFFIYSNQPDVTEFSYSHTVNTDTPIGSLFIYINPLKGTVEFDVEVFVDDAQYV